MLIWTPKDLLWLRFTLFLELFLQLFLLCQSFSHVIRTMPRRLPTKSHSWFFPLKPIGSSSMVRRQLFHLVFIFILTWIRGIEILVFPTLLESARGQRECLITYLIVHHCLARWSVYNRYQQVWDSIKDTHTSLATCSVLFIFSCPSQVVPDWLGFGTLEPM